MLCNNYAPILPLPIIMNFEATRMLFWAKITCPLTSVFSFFFFSPLLLGSPSSVAVFCFN